MSDLRRQLEELKRQVEALLPSTAAEDFLAQVVFRDPKFKPHLQEIIAHLCGATPTYSFIVEADPEEGGHPTRYSVLWYDHNQPPIVIQYTRRWREMRFGEQLAASASYDQHSEPPEQAVTSLMRSSYDVEQSEQTVNDTLASVAPSDLALVKLQPHSEQDAEPPAAVAEDVDVVAQIAAIQARIAQLSAEEPRQEQQTPAPAPAGTIVEQPSGAKTAVVDWARRLF